MLRKSTLWVFCIAVLVAGAFAAVWHPTAAQEKEPQAKQKPATSEDAKSEPPGVAAVRETNRRFAEAFARGDAKAIAALWTEDCEHDGLADEPIRGRAAIETAYARFFKENPKATMVGRVDSVRLLCARAATEEGTLVCRSPGETEPGETRFSAFLVLEDGSWRFASVKEWAAEPEEHVALENVAWLVGEWTAKGKQGDVRLSYTRDAGSPFLHGRHSVTLDGKVVSSGKQIIGKDPNGGLRSWHFEDDGGFGEWVWSRDGARWVIEATGTLPDGSEQTATHLLVPLDKNSFTWQVLERTTGGVAEPGNPPVRVTRAQAGK